MIKYHSINGQFVTKQEAVVNISDLGLHRGYAVFDYFKVSKGKPVFVDDYLARFYDSATTMCLDLPMNIANLKEHILEYIAANQVQEAGIKLILSGGDTEDGYTYQQSKLMVYGMEQIRYPEHLMRSGIKLMSYNYEREIPEVKTTNYAVSLMVRKEMEAVGAKDLLYYKYGMITESARSNVFLVKNDGTLVTPARNILFGVTRTRIIEIARELSMKVELREVSTQETIEAKEIFITSSGKGALAITQIDDFIIGNGKPGEVTKLMDKLYRERVQAHIED
jgi:branched-subunit amino acid aminotransferase/4-amino-4-deoxychorismate lyase